MFALKARFILAAAAALFLASHASANTEAQCEQVQFERALGLASYANLLAPPTPAFAFGGGAAMCAVAARPPVAST